MPTFRPRVLIVKDEPDTRALLAELCAQRALAVTQAADGIEGIAEISSAAEPFDVVLTDVQMPRADGFSVLASAVARSSRTRVVVMTGYGTAEGEARAHAMGAAAYVRKPASIVTIGELLDHLAQPLHA